MPELNVLGITSTSSLGPKGNHLRWFFPPEKGFPLMGFTLYRRNHIEISGEKPLFLSKFNNSDGHCYLDGDKVSANVYFPKNTNIRYLANKNKVEVLPVNYL